MGISYAQIKVNKMVNGLIVPEPNTEGVLAEKWLITRQRRLQRLCGEQAVRTAQARLAGKPLLLSEVRTA